MVSFTLAAIALVASASIAHAIDYVTPTAMGCYKSSQGLTYNDTWTWQSNGHCQHQCVPANKAVVGLTGGGDCWCGDTMPPLDQKVDSSKCDQTCNGWDESCGSADGTYFTIWNDGLNVKVYNYGASTTSASNGASSTTSAKPSVVTIGGQTQTVTAATTPTPSTKAAGPNKAGIAAGVVVGIIAIAAIAGGAFFFLRRKQKREEEDEIKRQAAINSFMSAKPGSSSMNSNDSRLDPIIMTRRQSDGSIMDNQDYSRRILKVTNA